MIEDVRKKLFALTDEDVKAFNEKLVPGTEGGRGGVFK